MGKVKSVHETTRNNKSKVDDLKFINGYEWKILPELEKYSAIEIFNGSKKKPLRTDSEIN